MLVYFAESAFGHYEMWPINKRIMAQFKRETGHESILIQTDWDWPGLATSLGWVNRTRKHDCYRYTDGTVNCQCGRDAMSMIEAAREFLDKKTGQAYRGKLDAYFEVY